MTNDVSQEVQRNELMVAHPWKIQFVLKWFAGVYTTKYRTHFIHAKYRICKKINLHVCTQSLVKIRVDTFAVKLARVFPVVSLWKCLIQEVTRVWKKESYLIRLIRL